MVLDKRAPYLVLIRDCLTNFAYLVHRLQHKTRAIMRVHFSPFWLVEYYQKFQFLILVH